MSWATGRTGAGRATARRTARRSRGTRWGIFLGAALLATFAGPGHADPPPASFTVDFTGDASIWNPFDGFVACEDLGGATGCLKTDNVVCNGRGRCTGDAEFSLSGEIQGVTTGPATMKLKCKASDDPSRPACRATLRFDVAGPISETFTGLGLVCDGEIRGKVNGRVDDPGFFDGRGRVRVCLKCPGVRRLCERGRGVFPYAVNPPTPWNVTVDVTQQGRRLVGTAMDSLGFLYTATGRYNPRRDHSKIVLKGERSGLSRGARVKLKKLDFSGSTLLDGDAVFRVQGNKARVDLP